MFLQQASYTPSFGGLGLMEGRFVWHDMYGHSVEGGLRLDTYLTVKDGAVVWQRGGLTSTGQC